MTLGQHIQSLRKEAGYSQEALGEALGVTRQSISKWESDQAIPEVDKLVTLSRLFQVPVGVLLQVEAPPETGSGAADPPAELSPTEPPPPRRWMGTALLAALGTGALVWLLLLTAGLFSQVRGLQRSLSELQERVDLLTLQMEEQRQAEGDLSAAVVLESADYRAGEAVFSFTAAPETVREGTNVLFTAVSDEFPREYIQARGQLNAGGQYAAKLTCPLADDITFSVTFDSGETKEVHTLTKWYGLLSDSCSQIGCRIRLNQDAVQNGVYLWDSPIELSLSSASVDLPEGETTVETAELSLRLYRNGEAVWGPAAVDLAGAAEDGQLQVPVSVSLELEVGDVLRLTAFHRDGLGRTWLERLAEYRVEEEPEGPLLMGRDQRIPGRVSFAGDWQELTSDEEYWK